MKYAIICLLISLASFTNLSVVTAQTEVNSASTNVNTTDVKTPSAIDSSKCKEQLSLYREYYKIKLYKEALPHWRWMLLNCPQSTQNTYIDGIKIMSSYIDETKDPKLHDKLIDTLMMVHDQRIKYYGREGYVLGRKAIDAMTYKPEMAEQAYPWFAKSVALQGNQSDGAVLVYYLNTAIQLANTGKLDKSEIFTVYDKVVTIADNNINEASADQKNLTNWVNIKSNIETIIEPLASCAELTKIYGKKFAETPNDIPLLKNITTILEKRNCTNEGDLFFKATANLHKLEPSAQSAYLMGKLCIQKEQLGKAAEYMSQAADMYTDNADKLKALYALASIQMGSKNYPQSRNTANKILQINPNEGKALILIGDLYAMSAGMCEVDDLSGKTVFWAAIDKYHKAKSVDSSVESQANEKIAQYSKYFPASSDLFFRDMIEGSSYTVGCWINETTTIRAAK